MLFAGLARRLFFAVAGACPCGGWFFPEMLNTWKYHYKCVRGNGVSGGRAACCGKCAILEAAAVKRWAAVVCPLPFASCAWPWAGLPGFFVVKRATNVGYLPLPRASPRCITAFIARPNGPFGVVAGAVWRRCACVFAIPHALFRLAAPGTRRAEMLNFRTISLQYAAPPLLPCRSHCAAMVLPVGFFCVLLPPWT